MLTRQIPTRTPTSANSGPPATNTTTHPRSPQHHRQTRTTTPRWLRTQSTGNAQQPHTTTIQTQERHHSPHTTTNTQGNTPIRKTTGTPRLHHTRTPVLPTHSTNTHLTTRKRPRPPISRIPPGQRWGPPGHRRTPTTITTRLPRRRNQGTTRRCTTTRIRP